MATYEGIDVSTHQGTIDWNRVKAAGVQFVIIRCGYGGDITSQDDSRFPEYVKGAEAAGIPWGTYLYSYATNASSAESEAQHVLRLMQGKRPLYPVYIDMESNNYNRNLSNQTLTDICVRFCQVIQKAGGLPGIYANKNWWDNRLNSSALDGYERWLAQWGTRPTYQGSIGLWQYTDSGSVAGISGNADRNISYKDYPEIIKLNNYNNFGGDIPIPPGDDIAVGDTVYYKGYLYANSYGGSKGTYVDGYYTVSRIIPDRPTGVLLNDGLGWVAETDVKVSDSPPPVGSFVTVGDTVSYKGYLYSDSNGNGRGKQVNGTYTVSRIIAARKTGILLNDGLGWVAEQDVTVVDSAPAGFKVGDRVYYRGFLFNNSYGEGQGKYVDGTYTISRIIPDRPTGILLNDGLGWVAGGKILPAS